MSLIFSQKTQAPENGKGTLPLVLILSVIISGVIYTARMQSSNLFSKLQINSFMVNRKFLFELTAQRLNNLAYILASGEHSQDLKNCFAA